MDHQHFSGLQQAVRGVIIQLEDYRSLRVLVSKPFSHIMRAVDHVHRIDELGVAHRRTELARQAAERFIGITVHRSQDRITVHRYLTDIKSGVACFVHSSIILFCSQKRGNR